MWCSEEQELFEVSSDQSDELHAPLKLPRNKQTKELLSTKSTSMENSLRKKPVICMPCEPNTRFLYTKIISRHQVVEWALETWQTHICDPLGLDHHSHSRILIEMIVFMADKNNIYLLIFIENSILTCVCGSKL